MLPIQYQVLLYILIFYETSQPPFRRQPKPEDEVHCIFIHGAGTKPHPGSETIYRDVDNLPNDVKNYWGDVTLWTKSSKHPCTSYAFTYLNTVNNPWDDESLAEAACETLVHKDKKQRIFLHSMGNLIFFNALRSKKCKISTDNTNVYSFGGPFLGSNMLEVAKDACAINYLCKDLLEFGKQTGATIDNPWAAWFNEKACKSWKDPATQESLSIICDPETENLTPAFASLDKLSPHGDKEILDIAKKYTKGAICGSNMEGKNVENLFLSFLGNKVHGTLNHDGVVHADSCKAVNPEAPWSLNSDSPYWLAKHNHNEIIGRYGTPDILKFLENLE